MSLEPSSECVVDGTGRIVRATKVPSEPETLVRFLAQLSAMVVKTDRKDARRRTGCR